MTRLSTFRMLASFAWVAIAHALLALVDPKRATVHNLLLCHEVVTTFGEAVERLEGNA